MSALESAFEKDLRSLTPEFWSERIGASSYVIVSLSMLY